MKKHWYKLYIEYCPMCGGTDEYRERVYGEKPKCESERYGFFTKVCCYYRFL